MSILCSVLVPASQSHGGKTHWEHIDTYDTLADAIAASVELGWEGDTEQLYPTILRFLDVSEVENLDTWQVDGPHMATGIYLPNGEFPDLFFVLADGTSQRYRRVETETAYIGERIS